MAFPSGGGFSNHFAMPSWQATQVQHYLSTARSTPLAFSLSSLSLMQDTARVIISSRA